MILQVQNGCFGYPGQPVILENIDLTLEEGHILAILGPNGIGKTTLLKCMIGLLPWHSGKTLLYGKDIHTLKPKEVWSTISYIPQSHGFAFSYTGLEMVLLGRSAHLGMFQQPGKEELEMAEAMMERVGISHLANKDCNRMSGGELQMVLIARALINDPKLIILDEPETGLDFHNQILVLNMVERLAHEEGISAIMNTHYPTNAMSVADEALMLNRKGEFFYGPAAEILNEENTRILLMFRCWWMNCIIMGGRCAASFRLLCGRKLLYEQCPFYTFPGSPDPGSHDSFPPSKTGRECTCYLVLAGRRHLNHPGVLRPHYPVSVRRRWRHISSGWREPYCPAASRPAAGRSAQNALWLSDRQRHDLY